MVKKVRVLQKASKSLIYGFTTAKNFRFCIKREWNTYFHKALSRIIKSGMNNELLIKKHLEIKK